MVQLRGRINGEPIQPVRIGRSNRQSKTFNKGDLRCLRSGCTTILSRYNPQKYCATHLIKKQPHIKGISPANENYTPIKEESYA